MPCISEEQNLYPDNLLEGLDDQRPDGKWWVLYTKARQEKAVARDLLGRTIPFYLPLVKKTTVYSRSTVTSHVPLFAGYVFMYGSDDERVSSLSTNRLSRILDVADADRLRDDLRKLRRLIASDAPLTVESRLAPGNRVRVRHGSLGGVEGTVLVRHGKTRLVVSVNFLQQGASIEFDDFMLEPIG